MFERKVLRRICGLSKVGKELESLVTTENINC